MKNKIILWLQLDWIEINYRMKIILRDRIYDMILIIINKVILID